MVNISMVDNKSFNVNSSAFSINYLQIYYTAVLDISVSRKMNVKIELTHKLNQSRAINYL